MSLSLSLSLAEFCSQRLSIRFLLAFYHNYKLLRTPLAFALSMAISRIS